MSDRSGGSAAIGGFLYQLIMHLDWIANLAVTDVGVGHKLVLEPRGGGDAHIHHANRRIIEQYKTRQNEGTWSIRDIVRGPFVDFVRAARTKKLQNDKFRFVTDGRISHQVGLLAFLERIAQSTRDGLAPDDQMVWSYTRFGKYTDRALLGWIRSEIEVELKDKSSLDDDTLAHVLSRVELLGGVDAAATEESLDDLLRRCLPDPSKACDVRLELVGRMLAQLLKTAINTVIGSDLYIGPMSEQQGLPPPYLVAAAFGDLPLSHKMGLYAIVQEGSNVPSTSEIVMVPIVRDRIVGGWYFGIYGVDFFLSLFPLGDGIGPPKNLRSIGVTDLPDHVIEGQLHYRVSAISVRGGQSEPRSLHLSWTAV